MADPFVGFHSGKTAPTFSVSSSQGTRTIKLTNSPWFRLFVEKPGNEYLFARLYDSTASKAISTRSTGVTPMSAPKLTSVTIPSGNTSVTAPDSTTSHSIVIQVGWSRDSTTQPTSWDVLNTYHNTPPTYSVSVPGKATYNIYYYNKDGSVFYNTTGKEGNNHTVIAGTGIGGFDHWNTAADDTGTSYSPGATRFIDGDLYFYAICNGIVVRRKINGEWKNCSVQAKVNGEWVPVIEGYIKVDDVWKPIV